MAVYMIVAVRIDEAAARIAEVRWGEIDPAGPDFVNGTEVVDVLEVVDAIYAGNQVYAHRTIEGRVAPGPRIRTIVFEEGAEGIEIDDADLEAGHTWNVVDLF